MFGQTPARIAPLIKNRMPTGRQGKGPSPFSANGLTAVLALERDPVMTPDDDLHTNKGPDPWILQPCAKRTLTTG